LGYPESLLGLLDHHAEQVLVLAVQQAQESGDHAVGG
jgi:hypothetical protein